MNDIKRSKVEAIKERSNYLREPVATEILQDTTHFSEDAVQILKFHGSYQQDNRDNRVAGQEKDYQFMLRTRSPGGLIPPQLYLTLDRLAGEYGNGTLRVTTRQGFQLHGILKKNLKAAIAAIVKNMGSTLGACGDLNRNVMAPAAPYKNRPDYQLAWEYANNIADLLTPQTGAYYEIWLDGEIAISGEEAQQVKAARQRNTPFPHGEEPIYGAQYMPRKFKCAVTVPGDNSVDLYTQDLTAVVVTDSQGQLEGFNIFAGGGLGRTHNKEDTFARIADPICFVPKADIYDLIKAIVATQRDYGDRTNRRHARLKYLIHDWGVEKFSRQVEQFFGKPLQAFQELIPWQYHDYLGWHEQGDGKLFLGLSINCGRIYDNGRSQLRKALALVVAKYQTPIRLTPSQNLILYEINPSDQASITEILSQHGFTVDPGQIDNLTRHAMACPALPTCGLAITEAERAIPSLLDRVRSLLKQVGLAEEHFVIRMTGCPNGCARPYMAELGLVGSGPDTYQIWLGGTANQTRLAQPVVDKLPIAQLEDFLKPILLAFKKDRRPGETFGDFCNRLGPAQILQLKETRPGKNRYRVGVNDDLYARLKAVAQSQGKPMNQITQEAIELYLKNLPDQSH